MAGFVDVDRTRLQKAVFALVSSKAKRRSQQKRDQQQMSEHAIDNSMLVWGRAPHPSKPSAARQLPAVTATLSWTSPSNFPLHRGNAFGLDCRVVAEPGQPMHIRFSPKPCDLALGI